MKKRWNTKPVASTAITVAIVASLGSNVHAVDTASWSSAAANNGVWSESTNWVGGKLPATGDIVSFSVPIAFQTKLDTSRTISAYNFFVSTTTVCYLNGNSTSTLSF